MTRILQLCAVDFSAHHFLLPLMRAQRAAGFTVDLACRDGAYVAGIRAEGFTVHTIPFERSMNLLAHARAYRALGSVLRRERYTVVHAHTPVASLIARPCARRAGVPLVLYTAHGFYFHDAMRPAVRRAHIALERWAQRYADFLFTQSAEDCATALEERIAPPGRALAIGNGVETARFDPAQFDTAAQLALRREFGLAPTDGPLIAIIGRLVREKGYFEFLEAFAAVLKQHPGARALLIGEALASDHDDSAAQIRARHAALGLQGKAIFTGLRRDIPALLALADIFCLPSYREGMPRSIIEAMAAGLPVVATDIRGCREEVLSGQTGLLVPPRESAPLAEALTQLVANPALRETMGAAGHARALQEYDEKIVIERQMIKLQELFNEKHLPWPPQK